MKKIFLSFLLLSAVLLSANGCGKGDSASGEVSQTQGQSAQETMDAASITQGDALFVQKYLSLSVKAPDGDYSNQVILADSYGSKLYIFSAYQETASGEGDWQCCLNLFDADTRQLEQQPFPLEIPEKEDYYALSMEVKGEDELSFRMQETGTEDSHEFLVRTDMAGNILALEDNFPDGTTYPWNPGYEDKCMVFDQTDGSTIL